MEFSTIFISSVRRWRRICGQDSGGGLTDGAPPDIDTLQWGTISFTCYCLHEGLCFRQGSVLDLDCSAEENKGIDCLISSHFDPTAAGTPKKRVVRQKKSEHSELEISYEGRETSKKLGG